MSGDDFIGEVDEKPTKPKKAKKEKPKYVYEGKVHPPGADQPIDIKLTADDLDPEKDPKLAPLFDFATNKDLANYMQMPSMRGIVNHIMSSRKQLAIDYANYKKRGRIK